VREASRAGTKVGANDPVVLTGRAIAQRIIGTPGITKRLSRSGGNIGTSLQLITVKSRNVGITPWEAGGEMGLTKRQKEIVIGIILGDGFLQKTGKRNARLRLEHSLKQKDYIFWKYSELKNMMQSEPKLMRRFNPVYKKSYSYYRCQSLSSPEFGRLRRRFYQEGRKVIPKDIAAIFKSPLSLAVWYMDDGYLYTRDKSAYIYLSKYTQQEIERLALALEKNFSLKPTILLKKKKYPCLYFNVEETKKLMEIIRPHIIPFFQYKLLLAP
jgi:hypothetical protein